MDMRGQRHAPVALPPRKRPVTHCTGGWVGPTAGLGRAQEISSQPGVVHRTVQPVASGYTHYAIPAHRQPSVLAKGLPSAV
jgi:hypothetical protein